MKAETQKMLATLSRASCRGEVTLKAAGGGALTDEMRDEMLARCAAGQYVELELECMAYEQKPGEQNRNFVRFRDGAMLALGRSGVGRPFLRDHEQGDALARGGTILESQATKRGEGDYAIRQRVKLTAPWAVELALRGLLDTLSIGWNATGDVACSVCSSNFYRCSHALGQRYAMKTFDDGSSRPVADANGPMVCERVYSSAELVETSAVSVPAVPSAQIDAIRAALSASPQEKEINMNPQILALLGLASTAGDTDITKAVESVIAAKKIVEGQRDELATQLAAVSAKLAGYETVLAQKVEDEFVAEAVRSGKLIPGSAFEQSLRNYHGKDAEGAKALVASSPRVTPIGAPGAGSAPPDAKASNADATITGLGGDVNKIRANLLGAGIPADKVEQLLTNTVGGKVA